MVPRWAPQSFTMGPPGGQGRASKQQGKAGLSLGRNTEDEGVSAGRATVSGVDRRSALGVWTAQQPVESLGSQAKMLIPEGSASLCLIKAFTLGDLDGASWGGGREARPCLNCGSGEGENTPTMCFVLSFVYPYLTQCEMLEL